MFVTFKMKSRWIVIWLAICGVAASSTLATQIKYKSVPQLGETSALVVRGKVVSSRSHWNTSHTKIYTETRIDVEETYKGQPTASVNVVQLGGVVDNVRVTVHGALHWRVGEEVVVFLDTSDGVRYQVNGFSQGKFLVERDEDTGRPYIWRPALEGTEMVGAPASVKSNLASRIKRVPLDEFISGALEAKR